MECAVKAIEVLTNLFHVETSARCPKTGFCSAAPRVLSKR